MTKQDLVRRMKTDCDGSDFISLQQFARYVGLKDPQKAKQRFLKGVPKVGTKYYIPEAAERIVEHAEYE